MIRFKLHHMITIWPILAQTILLGWWERAQIQTQLLIIINSIVLISLTVPLHTQTRFYIFIPWIFHFHWCAYQYYTIVQHVRPIHLPATTYCIYFFLQQINLWFSLLYPRSLEYTSISVYQCYRPRIHTKFKWNNEAYIVCLTYLKIFYFGNKEIPALEEPWTLHSMDFLTFTGSQTYSSRFNQRVQIPHQIGRFYCLWRNSLSVCQSISLLCFNYIYHYQEIHIIMEDFQHLKIVYVYPE